MSGLRALHLSIRLKAWKAVIWIVAGFLAIQCQQKVLYCRVGIQSAAKTLGCLDVLTPSPTSGWKGSLVGVVGKEHADAGKMLLPGLEL